MKPKPEDKGGVQSGAASAPRAGASSNKASILEGMVTNRRAAYAAARAAESQPAPFEVPALEETDVQVGDRGREENGHLAPPPSPSLPCSTTAWFAVLS